MKLPAFGNNPHEILFSQNLHNKTQEETDKCYDHKKCMLFANAIKSICVTSRTVAIFHINTKKHENVFVYKV